MSGFAVGGAAVGTLSDKLRIITVSPSFNFVGEDAIVSAVCITTASTFPFVGEDADAKYYAVAIPSEFSFVGTDAIIDAVAKTLTSTFTFVGEDGDTFYIVDTEKVPDLVATRVVNDITINVRNAEDDEGLILYKATSGNSNFNVLSALTGSELPYVDSVAADARPKYKAAFGVTGTIGGTAVTTAGRRSPSRYSR